MQQSDFQRFKAVMAGMGKLYERELDGVLLDAYWLALRDWSLQDFESAAAHLMGTAKFMPRPAEFNDLRRAGEMTSGEAWARVVEYVRHGWYRWDDGSVSQSLRAPTPPDQLVTAAVAALGGYRVIAMTDEDRLPYLEKRFSEHYDSIRNASETRQAIPSIAAPTRERVLGPRNAIAALAHEDFDA